MHSTEALQVSKDTPVSPITPEISEMSARSYYRLTCRHRERVQNQVILYHLFPRHTLFILNRVTRMGKVLLLLRLVLPHLRPLFSLVPPQLSTELGEIDLLNVYSEICERQLCDLDLQKVSDGIHVSLVTELSLIDYVRVRQIHCSLRHQSKLSCICDKMLHVAEIVLKEGYCSLSHAYAIVSPGVKYDPGKARRKLLQMPLASVTIGEAGRGKSFTVLIEYTHGVNYARIRSLLNGIATTCTVHTAQLEKTFVKILLGLAQSDREREKIRYAIYRASGVTATKARKQYGFEKMSERSARIKEVSREVQEIKEAIDEIASVQDEALLTSFGLQLQDSESSDEEMGPGSESEVSLISESYEAYVASLSDAYDTERAARALNGDIVTESESDDPEDYTGVHKEDLISDKCRKLIASRVAIQRRARRQKSKIIAERRFLSRKS